MATNTAGSVARNYNKQMVHYLRKGITYEDNGSTVTVGVIPAGSVILKPISGVAVTTAFNGDTTNTLDVGPSTDTDLWATDLALGSLAYVPIDEAVANIVTTDTTVQAVVTSTASASAGAAEIVIAYIPDNDQ